MTAQIRRKKYGLAKYFPEKGGMSMNERGGEAKTERRQKKPIAEALPSDGQFLMSRRVLSPSEEQGQRDAKLGSNLSLRASLGSASDRQWCLCGILDHIGGPAHSTNIKPISDVAPLLSRV